VRRRTGEAESGEARAGSQEQTHRASYIRRREYPDRQSDGTFPNAKAPSLCANLTYSNPARHSKSSHARHKKRSTRTSAPQSWLFRAELPAAHAGARTVLAEDKEKSGRAANKKITRFFCSRRSGSATSWRACWRTMRSSVRCWRTKWSSLSCRACSASRRRCVRESSVRILRNMTPGEVEAQIRSYY